MDLPPRAAVWVLGAAAVVSLAVAGLAWRRRDRPAAPALAVAMVAEAWWASGYAAELLATDFDTTLLWANAQWFGSVWVPVAWFVFALEYTGYDRYVHARTVGLLSVVPTASLVLVWTNPVHGLVRRHLGTTTAGSLVVLQQTFGPWFWVAVVYSYGLALVGSALFVWLLVRSPSLFGSQAAAVLVAAAAPAVGNVLYLLDALPWPWFDPTPISFAISGVAGVYVIGAERLFDTTSVPSTLARSSVVDEMDDGVVVVDADGRVVDANGAAATILDTADAVGARAADVVPGFDGRRAESGSVVVPSAVGDERYLDVRTSTLRDHHGRVVGIAVVLRDVTDQHHRQQQLAVLNRALRHNIRNEMNVIAGFADLYGEGSVDGDRLADVVESHTERVIDMAKKARTAESILDPEGAESEPVAVAETVERVRERVAAAHPEVRVGVEGALPDATCRWLVEPALANLVENGAEHNTAADPWVSITASADAETVTFRVADNGPGLPSMEAEVLRDRDETPTQHGAGLGLWLVAWATDRLGGTIEFDSGPEGGTVVAVTVPRLDAEAE